MKINVGITGQNGFIGSHLYQYFKLNKNLFLTIPFENNFFLNETKLKKWVSECDVIIHLAAISRHEKPSVVYETNVSLVKKLIKSLDNSKSKAHIIFASSIQEDNLSEYGLAKKEGRKLLADWCQKNNLVFTGLILPNVFGPLARPYYASVIATFSYQLTHNEAPEVITDSCLNLIYIDDLINIILNCILKKENNSTYIVASTDQIKVSDILLKLKEFKNKYIINNFQVKLNNSFERNLFYTFKSYI